MRCDNRVSRDMISANKHVNVPPSMKIFESNASCLASMCLNLSCLKPY